MNQEPKERLVAPEIKITSPATDTCVAITPAKLKVTVKGTSKGLRRVHAKTAKLQSDLDCESSPGVPSPCVGSVDVKPESDGSWELEVPVDGPFVTSADCTPLADSRRFVRAWGEYIDGTDTKFDKISDDKFYVRLEMPGPPPGP